MDELHLMSRAADPQQYDLEDLQWEKEGKMDNQRTFFFWEYLKEDIRQWRGKRILEIGAGNGWLLQEAKNAGALDVLGIEPSTKGIELARAAHPEIPVLQETLESYDAGSRVFDVIVSVMVLSHVENLEKAFRKVRTMLDKDGEVVVIVPDFEYFRMPRKEYLVQVQEIDSRQYVVQVTRPSGTIADIVRTNEVYSEEAEKAGLKLVEAVPMVPTDAYLALGPAMAQSKDYAISQLLRFRIKA